MKKILAALAAACVALSLGACSTAQQADASAKLAQLQSIINQGCMVVEPTLQSVGVLDPKVAVAATANGLFCATAGAITVTSAQSLVGTGIPAIEQAVTASTLIPADKKPLVMAALGVFQLTVTNALAVYGQASEATAPAAASAAVPASAPVAASPVAASAVVGQ